MLIRTRTGLRFFNNRFALGALFFVGLLMIFAILGPFLSPYAYDGIDWEALNQAPSMKHWLGTDELGRDLLTRIAFGARISLAIGVLATVVSVVIGVCYGSISGLAGGRVDMVMMRAVDTLYGLPFMFIVILLMTIFGRSVYNLFIALGAVQWLTIARLVRGQVLVLRRQQFMEGALAVGASRVSILWRHMVPNFLGPVIVYATLMVPTVIIEEAFLSFLGIGVPPPTPSWGNLIHSGVSVMDVYPWQLAAPAAVLVLTLLGLNFIGDGLRDALDPKLASGDSKSLVLQSSL